MILKLSKYGYTIEYAEKTLNEIIDDLDAVLVIAKGITEIVNDEAIRFELMKYAKNDKLYLVIPDYVDKTKGELHVSREICNLDYNITNILDKVNMEIFSPVIWDRRELNDESGNS